MAKPIWAWPTPASICIVHKWRCDQVQLAQEEMGDSLPIHLIRATAYGDLGLLKHAVSEYRTALKLAPNQTGLHLALGDTLFGLHRYQEAIEELQVAEKLSPDNSAIYALLARAYAHLDDREQTLRYVGLAEQSGQSDVFVSTGEALSILGDRTAPWSVLQERSRHQAAIASVCGWPSASSWPRTVSGKTRGARSRWV